MQRAASDALPSSFTTSAILAILKERKAAGEDALGKELLVEWEGEGGVGEQIWLPRALLMADGVTEGMVQEFEDNLVRSQPGKRVHSSCRSCSSACRAEGRQRLLH